MSTIPLYTLLRPASFKGIPFDVPDDESAGGRRIITHEYPGSDKPSQEDLGASPQKFTVTAVVGGVTFLVFASMLESALNTKGPGALIHPHYGSLQVVVLSYTRKHNIEKTGDVEFSINFERYGAPSNPSASINTAALLLLASGNVVGALELEFAANFTSQPLTAALTADALTRSNSSMSLMGTLLAHGGILAAVGLALPIFGALTGGAAGILAVALGYFQSVGAAGTPPLQPVVGDLVPAQMTPAQVVTLMQVLSTYAATTSLADNEAPTPAASVATRIANAQALDNLFRGAAIAAMGAAAQFAGYDSKQQAISIRSQMATTITALRDQLGASGWSQSWIATGQVLAALSNDINDQIGRLPETVQVKTGYTRSALELSNRLYGDDPTLIFPNSDDIVARNGIRNPCFVPPSELEVLIGS